MENLKKKRFQTYYYSIQISLYKCINKNFIFFYICLAHIKKKHLHYFSINIQKKRNQNSDHEKNKNLKSFLQPKPLSQTPIQNWLPKERGENQAISFIPNIFKQWWQRHLSISHRASRWKLESKNIPRNQNRQTNNICWIQFANRDWRGW